MISTYEINIHLYKIYKSNTHLLLRLEELFCYPKATKGNEFDKAFCISAKTNNINIGRQSKHLCDVSK